MERQHVPAGSPWGDVVGYSRAVKVGNLVFVAGMVEVSRLISPDLLVEISAVAVLGDDRA